MKAAVITPYYKEDISVLRRCHLSVLDQEVSCRHFMVADGFHNETVSNWDCEHIIFSKAHADNGNTPRTVGAISAINSGFDMILFLDVDNWFSPQHISEALLLKAQKPDIDIAILGRHIILPDGTVVEGDTEDSTRSHVDTSCYCFFESAFGLIPVWGMMQPFLGPIGDRIMFLAIKQRNYKLAWSNKKTCYFTSNYRCHYLLAGKRAPSITNDPVMAEIVSSFNQNRAHFQARTGLAFNINYQENGTAS